MQCGHGESGIIDITPKLETLKKWALSLYVRSQLLVDLSILRESKIIFHSKSVHKEEAQGRISADPADREGLQKKLEICINPLNPEQHSQTIINVVNRMIFPSSVNVDKTIDIGMEEFERKLLDSFMTVS